MVSEKVAAGADLHLKALTGELGHSPAGAAARILAHYRRRVRANRRRLQKTG
jgi:transcriptional regulator GlxA family with amidase domain